MSARACITLAIESSNPSATPGGGGVALVRGGGESGEILGVEALGPLTRHDDALVPAIDRLARGAGVGPGEIDRVAVSIGPGGYTALRIAVTTAKSIAAATGAALFGVPTAWAVMRRVPEEVRAAGPVAVLLAWKRGDVWVQTFERGESCVVGAGRLVALEEVDSPGGPRHLVMERRLREALLGRGLIDGAFRWSEPCFDPVGVFEASIGLEPLDPSALVPLYPREPEAITKWRARASGG